MAWVLPGERAGCQQGCGEMGGTMCNAEPIIARAPVCVNGQCLLSSFGGWWKLGSGWG